MCGLRIKRILLAMMTVVVVAGGMALPLADAHAIPTVLSSPEGERRDEVA